MNQIWGKVKSNLSKVNPARLKPKLDLTKTEDKLKLFILISGLIILIGVGSVSAVQLTTTPEFCVSCHEMKPEVMTWKATSHSRFKCIECHIEPGIGNLIIHKIGAVKELYLHVTNTYERPIRMSYRIENYVCEKCHSPANRRFTLSGDLIIPHDRHEKKGIYCVQCHSGVAHGDIASRGVTATGDLAAWTPAMGEENTAGKLVRPKMNNCLECHTARKITTKCEACHTTVTIPDNHKEASWVKDHGPLAQKDLAYCNKCHSFSLEGKSGTLKTAREYARGNAFCYKCHSQLPPGHSGEWRIIHKHEAKEDRKGCLICHDEQMPKSGSKATKTYCDKCHRQAAVPGQDDSRNNNGSSGTIQPNVLQDNGKKTGTHPPNWLKTHPNVIKEFGTTGGRCYDCHDRTNCFKCHTGGGKT